jgi:hypothetical protein
LRDLYGDIPHNQALVIVSGRVHSPADRPRDHGIGGVGLPRCPRLIGRSGKPGVNILALQDRRHALLDVVNLGQQWIGGMVIMVQLSSTVPSSLRDESHSPAKPNTG